MHNARLRTLALIAASVGLSGCVYGYGSGYYDDYGYSEYGYDDYPKDCYDEDGYLYEDCRDAGYIARRGIGYGSSWYHSGYGPYGWYNGFYYPGYSVYVYDRLGRRHQWRDDHRRYWEGRRERHGRGDRHRRGWRGDGDSANRDQRPPERRGRRGARSGGDTSIGEGRRSGWRGDGRRGGRDTGVTATPPVNRAAPGVRRGSRTGNSPPMVQNAPQRAPARRAAPATQSRPAPAPAPAAQPAPAPTSPRNTSRSPRRSEGPRRRPD